VRLRPPADVAWPTVFFDRSAIGLLGGEISRIEGFTRYPEPVTVVGQLARADDGRGVVGHVSVISTEITGVDPGIFASFQTRVDVHPDRDGVFSVVVPPGKYRVLALPEPNAAGAISGEANLSALEAQWEIRALVSPQAGKLLELKAETSISGLSPFPGAQVNAAATPHTILPFENAFGAAPFAPRGQSGFVDQDGRFSLSVDPGRFNISVRAPEALGFAWYVRPGVEVPEAQQDLGRIALPVPSVVRGVTTAVASEWSRESKSYVTVAKPLPFASVRAYAYLDKDFAYTRERASAVSVVQVAETRSDDLGAFRLLLPSSLAASN
jgi:hypothetical protein